MNRREFLAKTGLFAGGAAVSGAAATAIEQRRLDVTITAAGQAVGADRPAGLLTTTINYRMPTNEPVIALTFDDGPSAKSTNQVLDILDEKDVVATFFMIGKHAREFPSIAERAARKHEIGNHTWSHPNMGIYHAPDASAQLHRAEQAISEAIGRAPTIFRPPYGSFSGATAMIATSMRYPIVLWDIKFNQDRHDTAQLNIERLTKLAEPGSIILGHDGGPLDPTPMVDALAGVIDGLRARGFRFATVSQLLALSPEAKPGSTSVGA